MTGGVYPVVILSKDRIENKSFGIIKFIKVLSYFPFGYRYGLKGMLR